jgi:ABC-type glycerol-3-phosphate transport system permease component
VTAIALQREAGEKSRASSKARIARIAAYSGLAVIAALSLYPFALMILNSLKSNTQVLLNTAGLPRPATVSTYSELFSGGGLRGFVNSIVISAATTVGAVFLSAIAGYAFAKLYFRGRTVLFLLLLLTIMVPIQTAIPGFYLEFAKLGWLNTYQIQIVPFLAPVFGLFIVRQYLLAVPDELLEAARLDGAGEWYIFSRIILPISRPILAALGVLTFLGAWNSYLWPEIMASSNGVQPLSIVLPNFVDKTLGIEPLYGTIMAGCCLATVPLMLVFFRYQKAFVTGVTYGEG